MKEREAGWWKAGAGRQRRKKGGGKDVEKREAGRDDGREGGMKKETGGGKKEGRGREKDETKDGREHEDMKMVKGCKGQRNEEEGRKIDTKGQSEEEGSKFNVYFDLGCYD